MPACARRIMRLNPDNDTLSSVGDDLGEGYKYRGTVVGNDDCLYGIPYWAKHIIKFDTTNPATTSTVGEEAEKWFGCNNGVLGGDGYIYAANHVGQILKVDTTSNTYTLIGDEIYPGIGWGWGWGGPIVGVDKCIYWPPCRANRVLKFKYGQVLKVDTANNDYTWIADPIYLGRGQGWGHPIIGVDKCIYWPPLNANRVLTFDPETQQLPSLVGDDFG